MTPKRAVLTTRLVASRMAIRRNTATMICSVVNESTLYILWFRASAFLAKYWKTQQDMNTSAPSMIQRALFLYLSARGFIRNTTTSARHICSGSWNQGRKGL